MSELKLQFHGAKSRCACGIQRYRPLSGREINTTAPGGIHHIRKQSRLPATAQAAIWRTSAGLSGHELWRSVPEGQLEF